MYISVYFCISILPCKQHPEKYIKNSQHPRKVRYDSFWPLVIFPSLHKGSCFSDF